MLSGAWDALPHRPRRVLVAGTSGAGKTAVADRVGRALGLAHVEIDALFHGPDWTPRDSFAAEVEAYSARPSWVTEWQYDAVRGLLAERADLVVWLDLPRALVMRPPCALRPACQAGPVTARAPLDVTELFLAGARVVVDAIASDAVGRAWDGPSVLADQTVGGVAGHLARGGIWVVGDYLGATASPPVTFADAAAYYVGVLRALGEDAHRAIRARGAAVAAAGRDGVVDEAEGRLAELGPQLRAQSPDRLVAVAAGTVMELPEYLVTRIVEQVVHLDDLSRSVGQPLGAMPSAAEELTIAVGTAIGVTTHGAATVVRALYRDAAPTVLPVL